MDHIHYKDEMLSQKQSVHLSVQRFHDAMEENGGQARSRFSTPKCRRRQPAKAREDHIRAIGFLWRTRCSTPRSRRRYQPMRLKTTSAPLVFCDPLANGEGLERCSDGNSYMMSPQGTPPSTGHNAQAQEVQPVCTESECIVKDVNDLPKPSAPNSANIRSSAKPATGQTTKQVDVLDWICKIHYSSFTASHVHAVPCTLR